jgi:hypothetical protein
MKDYYYNRRTGKLVVNRIRRTRRDRLTGLPMRYTIGLTPSQKFKYKKAIQSTRRYYQKTGLVRGRNPWTPKFQKTLISHRSKHNITFERRYGFNVTDVAKVKKLFPDTDVNTILKKGRGAYASSGSRPTVTGRGGTDQWAYARLASVLTGGKALAVDKNLVGPKSLKRIFKK